MTKVEELKEEFERVRIAVRQIYCVKGSEFCRPELEMVFNLLAKTPELIEAVREEEGAESKNKFIIDIKKEVVDFKLKAENYEKLKHQDRDRECELIYKAKSETFYYVTKQINRLIRWYSI